MEAGVIKCARYWPTVRYNEAKKYLMLVEFILVTASWLANLDSAVHFCTYHNMTDTFYQHVEVILAGWATRCMVTLVSQ